MKLLILTVLVACAAATHLFEPASKLWTGNLQYIQVSYELVTCNKYMHIQVLSHHIMLIKNNLDPEYKYFSIII